MLKLLFLLIIELLFLHVNIFIFARIIILCHFQESGSGREELTNQQPPPPSSEEQEELDFLFDEEMEQIEGRKNTFTEWSESDSDYEIDDQDLNKILIVTQTPPYMRKHPGGDRTGNHVSRAKITSELAKVINDGLYYYEQDLWMEQSENDCIAMKVIMNLSNEYNVI